MPKRARGVFGGQVISQALVAATNCVDKDFGLHSLHCYFLLSASPSIPVLYYVERLREGKSYTTRSVKAVQNGTLVFSMTCSFQKMESDQPEFQRVMPSVPAPEACILVEDELEKYLTSSKLSSELRTLIEENVIERRMSPIAIKDTPTKRSSEGVLTQAFWMRAKSIPKYELPFRKVCSLSLSSPAKLTLDSASYPICRIFDCELLFIAPSTVLICASPVSELRLQSLAYQDENRGQDLWG